MPGSQHPHWWDLKRASAIQRLLVFRTFALAALALLLPIAGLLTEQATGYIELIPIISLMIVFHIVSLIRYRHKTMVSTAAMLGQILSDLAFLTLILNASGGATNAFVSLLLLPIVFAGVSLGIRLLGLVTLLAVAAYSYLLLTMPEHAMHMMDMKQHFVFMGANFFISALVIALVVGAMARMIADRERMMAQQREEQLRQEQLLALGIASAQVTHQLATPLSTLQLLYDELKDSYPEEEAVQEMAHPLQQAASHLSYFRTLASAIREGKHQILPCDELVEQLQDAVLLHFPEQTLQLQATKLEGQIQTDAMLLPALLNLIQNSAQANAKTGNQILELRAQTEPGQLRLSLRDHGPGVEEQRLDRLGDALQSSESGMGMALVLSSASFERLGGRLALSNHPDGGAIADITLKLEPCADETPDC
ncbi:sensor histidine kinase [Ferrimonas kyonanensis]|uniref:sensor histidine kinase n=1 Tax=Ferrimonas kyonanensis TaxID=364763 RepID=UPI00042A3AB0|nr:ATP-binding protein [Ferrimonas kyonanensis]